MFSLDVFFLFSLKLLVYKLCLINLSLNFSQLFVKEAMSAHKPARTLWHRTLHPQFIRSSFSETHLPAQRVQGPQQPQAESWQWPVQNDSQQLILHAILEPAKVCNIIYLLSTIDYCGLKNTLCLKVMYDIAEKIEFTPRFL